MEAKFTQLIPKERIEIYVFLKEEISKHEIAIQICALAAFSKVPKKSLMREGLRVWFLS
jgi:hypothetical protein